MGIVYRGVDTNLDRPVAIKILPPESQEQEESIKRFLREARTASKLQHPAITTIYEFGTKDNLRYLVMEYIEGQTLRSLLDKGPLPFRQAVDITSQVADALTLAGEKQIIHRDIKSENIMVNDRGQVKILDFGLAKMVEKAQISKDTFKTAFGLVMGTVSYMSPEQALGAELDPRTDIYSLGVVMYEMVAGRLPFTGENASVVLAKILNQAPPPLIASGVQIPLSLEKVITKCLEKNRDQRYVTGQELVDDLKKVRQELESADQLGKTMLAGRVPTPAAAGDALSDLVPGSVPGAAASAAPPPLGASGTLALSQALRLPQKKTDPWRKPVSLGIRGVHKLVSLVAIGFSLASALIFAVPFFKPERVGALAPLRWSHELVDPAIRLVGEIIDVNFTYRNFNFLLLGFIVLAFFLRSLINGRLEAVDGWVCKPIATAGAAAASGMLGPNAPLTSTPNQGMRAADASRMSLLRQYADARRILGEAGKRVAFLSVDVVGSTKMKVGEDKLVIEHAFAEYKKFLEHIFYQYHVYKVAWTPDGVMTCFPSVDEGVAAGRKILADLDWFNSGVNQMRTPFHVRCGLNFGEVLIPEDKPLEEISDHTIDVAGHLQKYAAENALWISDAAYSLLTEKAGFNRIEQVVDNHAVYAFEASSKSGVAAG